MTERSRTDFKMTVVPVLVFGIAMGYVEAAVVVYLRSALGNVPPDMPSHDPATFGTFGAVEIARELATLAMICAVGWLAGRSRLERLAWAAVVFGTWDIVTTSVCASPSAGRRHSTRGTSSFWCRRLGLARSGRRSS